MALLFDISQDFMDYLKNPTEEEILILTFFNLETYHKKIELPIYIKRIIIFGFSARIRGKIKRAITYNWLKIPFGCNIEYSISNNDRGIIEYDEKLLKSIIKSKYKEYYFYECYLGQYNDKKITILHYPEFNFKFKNETKSSIISTLKNLQNKMNNYIEKYSYNKENILKRQFKYEINLSNKENDNSEQLIILIETIYEKYIKFTFTGLDKYIEYCFMDGNKGILIE